MMPYQSKMLDRFLRLLPTSPRFILEIGSDLPVEVAEAVTAATSATVIATNPAADFPCWRGEPARVHRMRCDGRQLPFADETFDAVFSIATMEHITDVDQCLHEVGRVLKPKGVFFSYFEPIWSSSKGHHVYAVVGPKEARFWKPGRNPVPDFAHLLLTSEEMKQELRAGPCSEELVEPIIDWIYYSGSINRYHYEDYLGAFNRSPLLVQSICRAGNEPPSPETTASLSAIYGKGRDFRCTALTVVLRKPSPGIIAGYLFRWLTLVRRTAEGCRESCISLCKRFLLKTIHFLKLT